MRNKKTDRESFSQRKFIFVVGNSRSGTTMMSRILGNNSLVFSFKELHFFGELWASKDKDKKIDFQSAVFMFSRLLCVQEKGYFFKSYWREFSSVAKQALNGVWQEGWTAIDVYKYFLVYETEKNRRVIPCEQTPRNLFYLNEIFKSFPGAKIINMVRDPRDVLTSQKKKWLRRWKAKEDKDKFPLREAARAWINFHPFVICKLWNASINAVLSKYSGSVKTVFFEDLVNSPDKEIKDVCSFAGIEFSEAMLKVPVIGSSLDMDKPETFGIEKTKAYRWKKGGITPTEIYIVQKICGENMKKLNYQIVKVSPNPVFLVYYLLTFPFKLFFAFLFNLDRMKDVKENIIQRLKI